MLDARDGAPGGFSGDELSHATESALLFSLEDAIAVFGRINERISVPSWPCGNK